MLVEFWNYLWGITPQTIIIERILKANNLDWPYRIVGNPNDDFEADKSEKFLRDHELYVDSTVEHLLGIEKKLCR